jgi:uncharacterized protein
MQKSQIRKLPSLLKWILWGLLLQFILINISAAFYAYRFTHLYSNAPSAKEKDKNIFSRTWRLFSGQRIYKLPMMDAPSFPCQPINLKTKDNSITAWYSSQDGAKGCVLLFHGYTTNKSFLLNEAALFKQWGYNVFLVDFRGHGASTGHTTFGSQETDEVQQAFSFAKALGNKNIILYGVSMGAAVVLKATAEQKVQPTAIIADMPFASLQDHYKARARIIGFPSQPFAFLVTLWTGIENGYNGFDNAPVLYAKKITCPVLLEWGTKDPYVTGKETEAIFENLASKNKRMAIYPAANHESYLQVQPAGWEKEVTGFISSL